MLHIDHLTKHYKGSTKGVTDLTLHIAPGDLYAFIGHFSGYSAFGYHSSASESRLFSADVVLKVLVGRYLADYFHSRRPWSAVVYPVDIA